MSTVPTESAESADDQRGSRASHRRPVPPPIAASAAPIAASAAQRLAPGTDRLIGHPSFQVVGQCSARGVAVLGSGGHGLQAHGLRARSSAGRAGRAAGIIPPARAEDRAHVVALERRPPVSRQ